MEGNESYTPIPLLFKIIDEKLKREGISRASSSKTFSRTQSSYLDQEDQELFFSEEEK